jgi:hypothetical protein
MTGETEVVVPRRGLGQSAGMTPEQGCGTPHSAFVRDGASLLGGAASTQGS